MNMFEAKINNQTLSQFLKSANAISRECCILRVEENEITIPIVDESNSAQGKITLESESFSRYNVEPQEFVVNLSTLVQVVDAADDDESVIMEKNDEKGVIDISVGSQDYKLSLITRAKYEYKSLDIDYDVVVTLTDRDFRQAIDAADVFSDEILIKYDSDSDTFIFRGKGDNNMTKRELDSDEVIELSGSDTEATYGLSILKPIKKNTPTDTEVTMKLASNRPIEIKYSFEDGYGSATYFISPRLKE